VNTFTPVNALEVQLRRVMSDKNTPLWDFYTPLAAASLWVFVRNYPELDGSDLVAPPGQNPEFCVFEGKDSSCVALYTARSRAQAAFEKYKISPQAMAIVSAPGYQLLKALKDGESHLVLNLGLPECQYVLDPDMVEILLERPEPVYDKPPDAVVGMEPTSEVDEHLAPLREFLAKQPQVRAAWVFPVRQQSHGYEVHLVMDDPEDDSLLKQVGTMVKALTPVEMECAVATMMGDDQSLRNLSQRKPPFYRRADFLRD